MPRILTCANAACGRSFQSKPRVGKNWTRFCSCKCWAKVRVAAGICTDMTAAVAARKAKSKQRSAEKIKAEFGPLGDREIRLVLRCLKVGYSRGFNAGWRRAMRDQGRAA